MTGDVKKYFQQVADRLSQTSIREGFDTNNELEFWALAAEHVSRKEPPRFTDIVDWVDLLYHAPIHFVYKNEPEKDELRLYRHYVLRENIKKAAETAGGHFAEQTAEDFNRLAKQLEQVENRIEWSDQYMESGSSAYAIGECEHIPLFNDGELWGIYCVGPYTQSPPQVTAKLQIVARILSGWLVEQASTDSKNNGRDDIVSDQLLSDMGGGTLKLDRIASLMLKYLVNMKPATFGGILEQGDEDNQFLAQHNLNEEQVAWILETVQWNDSTEKIKSMLLDLPAADPKLNTNQIKLSELTTEQSRVLLFLATEREIKSDLQIESLICDTLQELLVYRRQNLDISDTLIDTYYNMLRQLEKQNARTENHTPRLVALVRQFGQIFGLNSDEQNRLHLTARLHDVGYIVTRQVEEPMTMGAELEHPYLGNMLVDPLPLHSDVKQGIKTHHEWIDGSGTPHGATGNEIPWTGKIIGLFEYINEFIESHRDNDINEGDQRLQMLSEKLIERADRQFDMVLVPTAIELLRSLGWQKCCYMSAEDSDL